MLQSFGLTPAARRRSLLPPRRHRLSVLIITLTAAFPWQILATREAHAHSSRSPNIIFIMADDNDERAGAPARNAREYAVFLRVLGRIRTCADSAEFGRIQWD